jgi:hypothetical protein
MLRARRCLLLLLVCSLIGCPAKIQVNSLPRIGWSKPIDRLFIFCTAGPNGSSYGASELQDRLARRLAGRSMVTHTWSSNVLDLADSDKLKAEIASFKPHYLLRISQIGATFINGGQAGASFDLMLTEPGLEEPVWRARTSLEGPFGGDPDNLAQAILDAMHQDGILPL